MDTGKYIYSLGEILSKNRNPAYAAYSKKYLRNQFEFFGIRGPMRKEIFRDFIKENGIPLPQFTEQVCRELYDRKEREFHYFAMEIANRSIKKLNQQSIKLFEYMVVTNAWWDTVDFIAVNILGRFFKIYPELIKEITTRWMESQNIWLQRSCILFQLKYKKDTDLELLYGFINSLKSSREFFIQKAIGWFLREYSKVDPVEVYRFTVKTNLKPLSSREALRIIRKKGLNLT